ncbi:MAG: hypothetical protein ACTSUK_11485, partial [Promethearchaeota archaeon]
KKLKTQRELNSQAFADLRKQNKENLKILENDAIKEGKSQEEINKILAERRLLNLQLENDAALRLFGDFSEEYLNANLALNKELAKQNIEAANRDREIRKQQFKDLEEQGEENLKIIENNLLKEGASRKEIEEQLQQERIDNLKRQNELALELFGEGSEEYLEANLKLNRALLKQEEEIAKEREEAQKQLIENLKSAVGQLADLLEKTFDNTIKRIDEQIARLGDEVDASKQREQELKDIAEERGLNADESIQAERDRQKKALDEQQELQRKKEEIETFLLALRVFASLVEGGNGNALANTKAQLSNLKSFASGLPGAYDGTNTTVGDMLGYSYIPGDKDTHVIKAHKDEMIIGREKMRGIKGMTQDEVVNYAIMGKNGLLSQAVMFNGLYESNVGGNVNAFDPKLSNGIDMINKQLAELPNKMPTFDAMYDAIADMMYFKEKRSNMYKIIKIKGRNG